MPNWCQNIVTMSGDEKLLKDCFDKFGGNEYTIDFNRIVPEPKELSEVEEISSLMEDIQLLKKEKAGEEISEKEKEHLDKVTFSGNITYRQNAEKALFCLEHYGSPSSDKWRCKNWGTKRDIGSDTFRYEWSYRRPACTFSFETAWSAAVPVIEKLATMYPELTFHLYESEPSMCADTEYVFQNGYLVKEVRNLL